MSEHKFTPGPWNVSADEVEALVDPGTSKTYYAPVCCVDTDWKSDIVKANANLIAAAPELLEALEHITPILRDYIGDADPIDVANEAIKKALGEEP